MEKEAASRGEEVSCIPISEFPSVRSAGGYLYKDSLHLTKLGCGQYAKLIINCLKATYPELDAAEEICPRCQRSGHTDCSNQLKPSITTRTASPQVSAPHIDVSQPPPPISTKPPELMSQYVNFPEFHPSIPWYRWSIGYWGPFL